MTYQVVNIITGRIVGKYATKAGARRVAERKDKEYGGYCTRIDRLT